MPSIGPLELVIVLVVILLIFGARRLPEVGRSLGDGMREFKDGITRRHDDKPVAGELEASEEESSDAGDGDDEKPEAVTSPPSRGSGDSGA
jgi:sec-independent protein translocase protein TatA